MLHEVRSFTYLIITYSFLILSGSPQADSSSDVLICKDLVVPVIQFNSDCPELWAKCGDMVVLRYW